MLLKVYKLKAILLLVLLPFLVNAQMPPGLPPGWEFTLNPTSHIISVPLTANPVGTDCELSDGDWIGGFYDDGGVLECGGAFEWDNVNNIAVALFGNDTVASPGKDGFYEGEAITWKIYLTATAEEKDINVTFASGPEVWTNFGMSEVDSIICPGDTQEIPVGGSTWTWISFNVLPTTPSVANVLSNFDPVEDDVIKSQSTAATYMEFPPGSGNYQWFPPNVMVDADFGYKFYTSGPATTLEIDGNKVDATDPIDIPQAQWKWIGYKPQTSLSVTDAVVSLAGTFTAGDIIKGQTAAATYMEFPPGSGNYQWFPPTAQMEPGQGYKIFYQNIANQLIYPDADFDGASTLPAFGSFNSIKGDPGWTPIPGELNMTVLATAYLDEVLILNGKIGAFDEVTDECRGVGDLFSGYAYFTVGFNAPEEGQNYYYMVWDSDVDVVYDIVETDVYVNNANIQVELTAIPGDVPLVTFTVADGTYLFENVPDDTWQVCTGVTTPTPFYIDECAPVPVTTPPSQVVDFALVPECLDAVINNWPANPPDQCEGENFTVDFTGVEILNAETTEWVITPPEAGIMNGLIFELDAAYVGPVDITLTAYATPPCADATETLSFYVNPLPVVTCPENFAVCIDADVIILADLGADPPGGTFYDLGGNPMTELNPAWGPDDYTFIYEYTDGNGCIGSCQFVITVYALPEVVCPDDMDVCEGEAAFELTGANPGGGTYTGTGVIDGWFYPAVSGVGTFEITYTYINGNQCTNFCVFYITVYALPDVVCPAAFAVCQNEGLQQLNGTGEDPEGGVFTGTGVTEDLGDYFFDPSIDEGVYTITYTYTDENGCTNFCTFEIEVIGLPVPYAGPDDAIEAGETYTLADATIGNLEEDDWWWWETSGTGSFSPDNFVLNPVYTPSDEDIASGSVELCLWVQSFLCGIDVWDCMTLTIGEPPCVDATADAGGDGEMCETEITYQLAGAATDYTSVLWETGGDGAFDDATLLDAVYTPGIQDILDGSVTLCLTAYAVVPCLDATDCMTLTIGTMPYVNAGDDGEICADGTGYQLTGDVDNADGFIWYTLIGSGTFDDNLSLTPIYTPTVADYELGSVELYLAATAIPPCAGNATDCMILTFLALPEVICPDDIAVCEDAAAFELTGATPEGGTYSGTGVTDGWFDPAVSGVGTFEITYTYIDGNQCTNFCLFYITVHPAPEVYAGEDGTFCQYYPLWLADATAENYSSLLWTTSGLGAFDFPDILNPVYIAAPEDAGTVVTLCLTAQPIDPCTVAAVDCRDMTVIGLATADAGDNAAICEYETFTTNGSATNYSSTMWTTDGDGTFGDASLFITVYFPGPNDIANGSVELCLTAFAIEPCDINAVDYMTLTIIPIPVITLQPVSVSAPWGADVDFIVAADFADSYQWFGPEGEIVGATDATLTIPDITLADEGDYYCKVTNECATVTSGIATLTVEQLEQIIDLPAAFNGFSTYLDLLNNDIANVVAPLGVDLHVLEFIDKVYIPGGSSFAWDEKKGAKAFMNNFPTTLSVFGYPTLGYSLDLPAGWSIMPVWNQGLVNAADVFDPLGADLIVAFSLDYSGIYWPIAGIYTLEFLVPGCSYYIALANAATLDFDVPIVDAIAGYQPMPANITTWNNVEITGNQHLFAVTTDALSQLEIGDVIGAFNQYGEIAGMVEVESMNNLALRVYADNTFTSKTDGFVNGDMITFQVFRPSTGEKFDVFAIFDTKMPNTNIFENEGLSMITNFKLGATSIGEIAGDLEVQIFPNPAKNFVNINTNFEIKNIKVVNYVGQVVFDREIDQMTYQINTSNFGPGMYFVQIETNDGSVITKRLAVN